MAMSAIGGRPDVPLADRDFRFQSRHQPGQSESAILARSASSRMKVWPDKMALLTQGGVYGAAIENWRQDEFCQNAQGNLSNGPQRG